MTRLLLAKGYRVVGTSRNAECGDRSLEGIPLLRCTLTDQEEVAAIIEEVRPREIYNFAAFSTGAGMFDNPVQMGDVNGQGPVRFLESIRRIDPTIRFCQASSAEMFGARSPAPQSPQTPFDPRSPYGAAKQYAHAMVGIFRARYSLFACSAILFNHESEFRPATFVTRKITRGVARIHAGLDACLKLGDLTPCRDWGFAGDYMKAAWMMLQAEQPSDYVVATGKRHSVEDFARIAFEAVGLDYRDYVQIDPQLARGSEEVVLVGDPTALQQLGWAPTLSFEDLIHRMVQEDLRTLD